MIVRSRVNNWLENPFFALSFGSPFASLNRLSEELEHAFSPANSAIPEALCGCEISNSAFSLEDRGSEYVLTAHVPGLTEKDLDITVTPDHLTLRGQRKVQPPEGYTKIRQERMSYSFDRSVQLKKRVDSKRVDAKLTNGTLTITLPKDEGAQPHRVSVLTS